MPGERGVVSGDFARTLAVARFLAADVLRSQRYLLPLLVYAAVLGVLFGNDPGPPPGPWAASALALYPLAAWFAVGTVATKQRISGEYRHLPAVSIPVWGGKFPAIVQGAPGFDSQART